MDPRRASDDARSLLAAGRARRPAGTSRRRLPITKDPELEELVRLYRELPERQRQRLLTVVRATAAALGPSVDAMPAARAELTDARLTGRPRPVDPPSGSRKGAPPWPSSGSSAATSSRISSPATSTATRAARPSPRGCSRIFTDFSMTTNPLSKNARYAQAYGFDGLVVPPGLVMLVVFSQSVEDVSENARANLEYIDMRFGVPGLRRRHDRGGDARARREGVVAATRSSASCTCRPPAATSDGEVVLTFQRKVQVWKRDTGRRRSHDGEAAPERIETALALPPYDPARRYRELAHLTNADTYFEDFTPGDVIEHSRGRVVTTDHIMLTGMLDNTSQVHCNQWMVDAGAGALRRRPADRLRRHPVQPLPRPLVGRRRRQLARRHPLRHRPPHGARSSPATPSSPAPRSAAWRDFPGRPDLGVLDADAARPQVRAQGRRRARRWRSSTWSARSP